MGTGESVKGYGECQGLRLQLQGLEILEDFLPLKLGNSDLILGVQWLEKLGPVTTNWKTQIMKFQINGVPATLKGDPSLDRSKVTLKNMLRTMVVKENDTGWVTAKKRNNQSRQVTQVEEDMKLNEVATVVTTLIGLIYVMGCHWMAVKVRLMVGFYDGKTIQDEEEDNMVQNSKNIRVRDEFEIEEMNIFLI